MRERSASRFSDVIAVYRRLEPHGTDTWNPLRRERELVHRLALYEQLCLALRRCAREVSELRVLDVGCGTGRSTRMYLDFGLRPQQLTGVDLRPSALALARSGHGGIRYLESEGDDLPLASGSVDWVSLCTVVSSVPGRDSRRHLTAEVLRVLAAGGFVFYWDRRFAHDFAGGDELVPQELFPGLQTVSDAPICVYGNLERHFDRPWIRRAVVPLMRSLSRPRTHRACLLQKQPDRPAPTRPASADR